MIIAIVIIVLVLILIFSMYNSLDSNIDVYLNERFSLIPNLVECVKSYSEYESETIEKIIQMRSEYMKDKDKAKGEALNKELNKFIAVAENYPQLKASEQYINLQKNLEKMESQLQAARRIYNTEVTEYNNKIATIPTNIIASIAGFKEETLFEVEDEKKQDIKIDL